MATPAAPQTTPDTSGIVWDSQPTQPAQNAADTSGIVWDKQPTQPAPPAQTRKPAPVATMQATEQPKGSFDHVQRWANDVADDLRYGTNRTGIGSLLKHIGAQPLESGTSSGVADFMGSIPLGALKMIKGASEYLNPTVSPLRGVKDVAGGALQVSTIPASFIAPESGEAIESAGNAAASGVKKAASAVAEQAGKAANAVKKPFSLKAVQEALENAKQGVQQELSSNLQHIQNNFHGSVRDLFDSIAQDAGVQPKPAESLRDVAANTASAIKAKASALYKTLDQAIGDGGTRFQTFDEQLGNVKRALRNSAGIDPDADGRLVERINALEDAKAQALEQAKAKGVNPDLIHEANATHRQAMALEDLSKHLQASMSGLREDVAQGLPAGVKAAPEALSPARLAPRANRLYSTGRLQQALGESQADDLLRHIETTKQAAQDAVESAAKQTEAATTKAGQQKAGVYAKRVGAGIALSQTPLGHYLKHLLFE